MREQKQSRGLEATHTKIRTQDWLNHSHTKDSKKKIKVTYYRHTNRSVQDQSDLYTDTQTGPYLSLYLSHHSSALHNGVVVTHTHTHLETLTALTDLSIIASTSSTKSRNICKHKGTYVFCSTQCTVVIQSHYFGSEIGNLNRRLCLVQ